MDTDGSIVIGTELSTDKFDKQISNLERKIDKEENKKIIIETKLSNQEQELERAKQQVDELADAYQKLKAVQEKVAQGNATPQDFETLQNLQAQYGTLEKIDNTFQKAMDKQDALQLKIQQTKSQYEGVNQKVAEYKQKLNTINIQKQKADVDQLKGSIDKMGSSFTGAVKKAGKLALAIFGIRTAYMLLQRASSELSSYDEQYAANLEYIRFVLTQAVAPILRYIVNLVMQLLAYVNAIAQAWFGVNLFANGSVEAFQKMKKGASGVSKAVKEIKKQLLGFDEINMLTDQSDTGTSAGAGGVAMPSLDLSSWQGKIPDWLQWIIDHKNEILALLTGIATALLLIKFGMSGIKALGIGLIVAGIVLSVQSLLSYLKDPTWKNFGNIIKGIGLAIGGLAIVIASVPLAIIAAALVIHGIIISYWDKIKEKWQEGIDWIWKLGDNLQKDIGQKLEWLPQKLGTAGAIIRALIQTAVLFITSSVNSLFEIILKVFDKIYSGIKKVLDGIILIFKGNFKEGIAQVAEGIKDIIIGAWMAIYHKFIWVWETILNMFRHGGTIFNGLKEGISDTFKNAVNGIIIGINNVMSYAFSGLNGILNRIRDIRIDLGAFGSFSPFSGIWGYNPIPVPQIPMLKTGAIINMPNKGTLVGNGSALGGEAGKEGVIPLTDQQAMSELGREIGKNVLINLTNIMQMNGRVIGREMKQITNTQDFAYNR